MKREAIVIIPGSDSRNMGYALDRFVEKQLKKQSVAEISNSARIHELKHCLTISSKQGNDKKTIDVTELYWGDILQKNDPSGFSLYQKVVLGLELIFFWIFSSIWKAGKENKYLLSGMVLSGLLLVIWYISILAFMLTTFQSSADAMLANYIDFDINIGPPPLWAALTIVLGLLPTEKVLRVSGFSMRYLKSRLLQDEIKLRIENHLNSLIKNGKYDRITLFSHSLGTLPALHLLSNFNNISDTKIRSITLGSSISFMSIKSDLIKQFVEKCKKNKSVDEWIDYFTREDWMCSYEKIDKLRKNFQSQELKMDSGWYARFGSKVHLQYFDDQIINDKLLSD